MHTLIVVCSPASATLATTKTTSAKDVARADALFKEGRAALEQGQFARACPLLKASFDEDPTAIGTLLNLAYCHEAIGQRWQAYREYDQAAQAQTTAERRDFAARSRAAVARKLPHVKLDLGERTVTSVTLDDGSRVEDPSRPFPVEPGRRTVTLVGPNLERTISFDAPNRTGIVALVVVPAEGVRVEAVAPTGHAPPATASDAPPSRAPQSPRASLVPWAIAAAGVGAAGIGAGIYFGLKSFSIRDSACPSTECDAAGLDRIRGSATTTATLSTLGFAIGAAGAIATVTLLVLDGSRGKARVGLRTTAQGAAISLGGTF